MMRSVHTMTRSSSPRRRAFTLMETVIAAVIFGVIAIGLGSAVLVAAKAAPASGSPASASVAAGAAVDEICGDLKYATRVGFASATAVEFTIADRDNDGDEETIRYEWSGTARDPLMRRYNGVATTVVGRVDHFDLRYQKDSQVKSETVETETDSGDVLLSGFNGWTGITPTASSLGLSSVSWASQYFKIDRVTLPADLTEFAITSVRMKFRRVASPAGPTVTVGIYRPAATGGPVAATTRIGSEAVLTVMDFKTAFDSTYVTIPFTDAVFSTPQSEFVLLVKGSSTGGSAVQYYNAASAPTDTPVFLSTANSGGTWAPTSNRQQNDMPFEVWGRYKRRTTTTQNLETFTLKAATIALISSDAAHDRLETAVETPNHPAVAP